jgi:hypothetical protein
MGKTPISTCQQLTNARTHHHQTHTTTPRPRRTSNPNQRVVRRRRGVSADASEPDAHPGTARTRMPHFGADPPPASGQPEGRSSARRPEILFECSRYRNPEVSHTPPTQTHPNHKTSTAWGCVPPQHPAITNDRPRATTISTTHAPCFTAPAKGTGPADVPGPENPSPAKDSGTSNSLGTSGKRRRGYPIRTSPVAVSTSPHGWEETKQHRNILFLKAPIPTMQRKPRPRSTTSQQEIR